jgi:hypothetical protein
MHAPISRNSRRRRADGRCSNQPGIHGRYCRMQTKEKGKYGGLSPVRGV